MCRRWGTPQNFCLTFIDELEKQLLIKKLMKWAKKKNVRILILVFRFVFFFFFCNRKAHFEI